MGGYPTDVPTDAIGGLTWTPHSTYSTLTVAAARKFCGTVTV